jgi:hypothetical protein
MAEEKDKGPEPAKDPDAERAAWPAFLAELRRDPAFQFVQVTGEGFIITGQWSRRRSERAAEGAKASRTSGVRLGPNAPQPEGGAAHECPSDRRKGGGARLMAINVRRAAKEDGPVASNEGELGPSDRPDLCRPANLLLLHASRPRPSWWRRLITER